MNRIDGRSIDAMVDRGLAVLNRTFHASAHGGGWYHRLDNPSPGPSATAAGVMSFRVHGRVFEHETACLAFLRHRQVTSDDERLAGGWALNTSFGRPVTEATGLVTHFLLRSGTSHTSDAPDVRRAGEWLLANQNVDGGWGSFGGQESRVWLTAMALRAITGIERRSQAVKHAVAWLMNARDPATGAWGETRNGAATVTHTSYILTALLETGLAVADTSLGEAVASAYSWLVAVFDPTTIHDDDARIESYNVVSRTADGSEVTWQSTIWHPGLPFALSALVRAPALKRFDLIASAVRTMAATQSAQGTWPGPDSSAAFSVWSVAPFLDALADVRRHLPLGDGLTLTPLSPYSAVVQGGPDASLAAERLITVSRRRRLRQVFRRSWAAGALALLAAAGGVLYATGVLDLRDIGFGLLVPIALLVLQLALGGSRRQQKNDGRERFLAGPDHR